jgi:hypothetical protein
MTRPPERDDLDAMLEPLIAFAQGQLQKHGEFYPFGCTMKTDGQVEMAGGHTGDEHPQSQDVIDLLVAGMRSQAASGSIRAAAICYDVKLRRPDGSSTDAISMSMEHVLGDRVQVVMPYSKGRFSGWKFGDLSAMPPSEARVFTALDA